MENAQPEPSMEEILASIRRIISEDEEEGAASAPAPKAAAQPPQPALKAAVPQREAPPAPAEPAEPMKAPRVAEAAPKPVAETPVLETEDTEMLKKNVEASIAERAEAAILDQSTADAASQAFQSLSQTVRVADKESRTLEDIVVAMLQPMIKDWLDANLPAIVEEKVEEEVQRVSRRRG